MDFSATLLDWFRENGRDLPWRQTRDPYAIWLSEIILQQTQVKQGWDYWERFMRRWPTVEALAAATEDEVLREWQGLGYYSRARNLHHAARQVVEMGGFPQTLEGLRSLKGVGDYTAAAIGSIAFGLPAAVVDGNVYRVLARHFGIDTPINTTEGKKLFQTLAQSLLPSSEHFDISPSSSPVPPSSSPAPRSSSPVPPSSSPAPRSSFLAPRSSFLLPPSSEYNQAIMDFGAIQCTPQSPRCLICPLMETCDALRTGRVAQLPVKQKTLKVKERHLSYIYIRCEGQVAIHRRGAGDIWQGLWEPYLETDDYQLQPKGAYTVLQQGVKHVLTHRVLLADFALWQPEERPLLPPDYIWVDEAALDDYAVPRLVERLYAQVRLRTTTKFVVSSTALGHEH